MEQLYAALSQKTLKVERGQEVQGKVISNDSREIILDLGIKSEGSLPARELSKEQLESLKIGDSITAYVLDPENEAGQTALTLTKVVREQKGSFKISPAWFKLTQSKQSISPVSGKVIDVNKGGFIVEVLGIRGFLPSSQIGQNISLGMDLQLLITEVDQQNNNLILAQKKAKEEELNNKIIQYKIGQALKLKISQIYPFGLLFDIDGVLGLLPISEVSWQKVEDLSKLYKIGQEIEVVIMGIDQKFSRLNLSVKRSQKDPFEELAKKFNPDDVVKGKVESVLPLGVVVKLEEGVEGFIPTNSLGGNSYGVGKEESFLVDSVDLQKRRILLTPLVKTTKDLIYR